MLRVVFSRFSMERGEAGDYVGWSPTGACAHLGGQGLVELGESLVERPVAEQLDVVRGSPPSSVGGKGGNPFTGSEVRIREGVLLRSLTNRDLGWPERPSTSLLTQIPSGRRSPRVDPGPPAKGWHLPPISIGSHASVDGDPSFTDTRPGPPKSSATRSVLERRGTCQATWGACGSPGVYLRPLGALPCR